MPLALRRALRAGGSCFLAEDPVPFACTHITSTDNDTTMSDTAQHDSCVMTQDYVIYDK